MLQSWTLKSCWIFISCSRIPLFAESCWLSRCSSPSTRLPTRWQVTKRLTRRLTERLTRRLRLTHSRVGHQPPTAPQSGPAEARHAVWGAPGDAGRHVTSFSKESEDRAVEVEPGDQHTCYRRCSSLLPSCHHDQSLASPAEPWQQSM